MDLRGNVALVVGSFGSVGPADSVGPVSPVSPVGPAGSAGSAGAAVADRLAALGASVAVFDRHPAVLASRLATAGGHSLALAGDPCDGQSVRAAVSRLLTAWERIDILVTGVDGLAEVAPAVSRYLPEAARSSTRGVADLIVLGPSGSRRAQAGARIREIRRQLAGEPVRVELVDWPPGRPGDVTGRVLELIGRPASGTVGEPASGTVGRPAFPATGRAG